METTLTVDSSESNQEQLPEFPRLTGPLGQLIDAITADIPYEHKALSALTYAGLALSGRTSLAGDYEHLQPRFYACLVGPPSNGKSAAQNEVKLALRGVGGVHEAESINSGPALVMALKQLETPDNPTARLLYLPDEGTGAFQKARHGRAFPDFLHLLEHNDVSHRVRDEETKVHDAHFAMVVTATPQGFEEMWQGEGQGKGLPSRFVLSFSDKPWPFVETRSDAATVSMAVDELKLTLLAAPTQINLPSKKGDFTFGLIGDGSHIDRDRSSRVVAMGRRFALVLAACNSKAQIDEETMAAGKAFINYQIAAQSRLMPGDSWSRVQTLTNRIISYFKRHPNTSENDARRNIKPEKCPAGLAGWVSALNTLKASGKLKSSAKNQKSELWSVDE